MKFLGSYSNKIILRPSKPKGCNGKRDISKLPERNLHILKCKKFEREGIRTGMCLALVAKEVSSDSSIVDVPLPPYMRVSKPVENFAKHIHDLHAEIKRKISLSNEEYKLATDVHCRSKEFNVGDYVMVRIHPERIPKTFSKNFMQEPCALILSFVNWDIMHIFLICLMTWILTMFSI